jgi:hypothetical protein
MRRKRGGKKKITYVSTVQKGLRHDQKRGIIDISIF